MACPGWRRCSVVGDAVLEKRAGAPSEACPGACAAPWPQEPGADDMARMIAHLRGAILGEPDQRERAVVLYTDAARRYLGEAVLTPGTSDAVALCPRTILATGFALGACGMILAHNHPSGECRPSTADEVATRRLAWLGQMVGLVLHDHLIVTADQVYSMRAGGLL
jgi:DNA repair protein RadC